MDDVEKAGSTLVQDEERRLQRIWIETIAWSILQVFDPQSKNENQFHGLQIQEHHNWTFHEGNPESLQMQQVGRLPQIQQNEIAVGAREAVAAALGQHTGWQGQY